jgi:hypothetical protein
MRAVLLGLELLVVADDEEEEEKRGEELNSKERAKCEFN